MKNQEELEDIYRNLNDNEKYGVQFGLFPVSLVGLNSDECSSLMRIRMGLEKNDVNLIKRQ